MKNIISKYKNKILMLVSFIAVLLPKLWIAMQAIPLRSIGDEMGHIAGAAYFSGVDWGSSIVNTQYYGQGFYSLFFWVFWLTDNPIIIYRIILSVCCILQSLVVFIAFYICKKYAKIDNIWINILISISSCYMIVTRVDIIYNESILNVITWLIFLVICKIIYATSKRESFIWSVYLCLLIGWSITIHLRMLVCLIAIFIIFFLYYIIMRKEYKILYLIFSASIFGMIGYGFTKYIQNVIWRFDGNTNKLGNTTLNLGLDSISLNLTSIIARIDIVFGQINTITVFSCSFFTLSIIILITYLWKYRGDKENKFYSLVFVCGGIFLLSILGTCFAQALSWGNGVYKGIVDNVIDRSYYSYKGLTYVRYFGPYVSPLIAIGSMILWKNKVDLKTSLKVNIIILIGLVVYWLKEIQYFIHDNTAANEVYVFFSQMEKGQKIEESVYFYGLLWVMGSALFLLLFLKKHAKIIYGMLSCVMIWNYLYTAYNIDLYTQEKNYEKINKSYELILNTMEETEEIYYYYYEPENPTHKTYATNYLLLQFWSPRKRIIPLDEKFNLEEDTIVISNKEDFKELIEKNRYLFTEMDENEYLFIFGKYIDEYKKYLRKHSLEYEVYE